MFAKVNSLDNQEVGQIEFSDNLYPKIIRQDIIKRVIDWQLAKSMSGCHKTKTRSEISGTGKKPFAQKGTGRARQGSNKAPHMRGGAVVHGPVVRDHSIKLSKKFRRLGLRHALASKYFADKLTIIDTLSMNEVSTSSFLKKISWINSKSILFIDNIIDNNFRLSCSNRFSVNVLPECGLNVYDIVRNEHLVITQDSLKKLEERLIRK